MEYIHIYIIYIVEHLSYSSLNKAFRGFLFFLFALDSLGSRKRADKYLIGSSSDSGLRELSRIANGPFQVSQSKHAGLLSRNIRPTGGTWEHVAATRLLCHLSALD